MGSKHTVAPPIYFQGANTPNLQTYAVVACSADPRCPPIWAYNVTTTGLVRSHIFLAKKT